MMRSDDLPSDTCRAVALRLAALGLERLPVVDDSVSRRLVGLVSRSDLLKPSHVLHDEDVRRERVFGFSRRSPER
jgi:CBS-domain-containing membrane protein